MQGEDGEVERQVPLGPVQGRLAFPVLGEAPVGVRGGGSRGEAGEATRPGGSRERQTEDPQQLCAGNPGDSAGVRACA